MPLQKRTIRSFVRRDGRLTGGQRQALQNYWPHFGIDGGQPAVLDFTRVFANEHPVYLEIGFGNGDYLLHCARSRPQHNFVGIEVYASGVGQVLQAAAEQQLSNLRVLRHDAIEVLRQQIALNSLAGIYLLFPDPWPKKRHHKRRIVQDSFVQLVRARLQAGGFLHMATDWQPYAEHMLQVMQGHADFCQQPGEGPFSVRPDDRPLTRFEKRGQKRGHLIYDLHFNLDSAVEPH
ncbi:MAG: tRNA (guanosine(46)-N7)-methyltransferase TrmB [gamma proteobacterium symbiont of Bathyaustriella thionipta]|nr:tRNA (guanosine(46)-N7)-methyltransferase TrmB [gamma proteobacterium symbiont of Bathyaustriella thionipta]